MTNEYTYLTDPFDPTRTDAEELRQLQTNAVQDAANERQLRDQSRAIAPMMRNSSVGITSWRFYNHHPSCETPISHDG